MSDVKRPDTTLLQAQLIPQLIINYKLKVGCSSLVKFRGTNERSLECGTHADEGHDIQDVVHCSRRSFRVRCRHIGKPLSGLMPCFRFCIKMPILHRLACFRDDVVFLVFLYQVRTRPLPMRLHMYGMLIPLYSGGYTGLIPSE
jgi:hypothetical protein